MNFIQELYEMEEQPIDVASKIKAAEKSFKGREGTKGFALENEDGSLVKVFVKQEQAEDFEKALSREMIGDDDEFVEIPELLFKLRKTFDIVDVEWGDGSIPEDEEEVETKLEGDEEGDEGSLDLSDLDKETDDELGEEGEKEEEDEGMDAEENLDDSLSQFQGSGEENEDGAYSALNNIINMMKADADAKKSEADAKKAQAEVELAKESLRSAEYRAAQEEEILDMEEFNKKQSSMKKDHSNRDKLIKYRHELKKLGESMKYPEASQEEEEILDMEDFEKQQKSKKEKEQTRERLLKFRHEKKKSSNSSVGSKVEDEEHIDDHDEFYDHEETTRQFQESFGAKSLKEMSFGDFLKLKKKVK